MPILTLIPEAQSYGIVILVVCGLGCMSLSAHIHARWFSTKAIHFTIVHACVAGLVACWGFLIVDASQLVGRSPLIWLGSIPLGLVVGWLAVWSDRAIVRTASRRQLTSGDRARSKQAKKRNPSWGNLNVRVRSVPLSITTFSGKSKTLGMLKMQERFQFSLENRQFLLFLLVVIAVFEELIFRGFLVSACFLLTNNFWIAIAVIGLVVFFALSHIFFGWLQAIAKLPLSILTTISVLASGSVLPAIFAHITFNIRAWQDMKNDAIVRS